MSRIAINDLEKKDAFTYAINEQELQLINGGFRLRIGRWFDLRIGGNRLDIQIK